MSNFNLSQKITHWNPTSVDKNGAVTYAVGVAVDARWLRKDGIARDESGTDQKTTHVVYARVLIPKRAKIALSDLNGTPTPPDNSRVVIDTIENPSMTDMIKMVL